MAQSTTVDQAVVSALVTEITNVLSFGGSMDSKITLDGFSASVSVQATVAPDVPVLSTVKTA